MINPWEKFKRTSPPYVLKADLEDIRAFNKRVGPDHRIDTNDLPVPFVGDPFKAEIILLQLNPGSDVPPGFEGEENHALHVYPQLKKDMIKNNRHEKLDYPFYCLNPSYRLCGGFRYWLKTFSSFIHDKADYRKIVRKVCCIEFFPYHSKRYRYFGKILECQEYSFYLAREAIKRKALIVKMKEGGWYQEVEELNGYKRTVTLKSRSHVLSKNNIHGDGFEQILKALNK